MATFNKVNSFVEDLAEGVHNLGTDVLKAALTNTAPTSSQTTWNTTDHPPPAAANGYTAGGNALTVSSSSQSGGVYKLVVDDTQFIASGGQIGPFRYVPIYNSSKSNKLVGWYDYGSSITLDDTQTFTLDASAVNGLLQIS